MSRPEMRYFKYKSGELRADGEPGFETPTGKFEIASEWFRKYGYEPLPVYTEPSEGPLASPTLAERFPIVFNSGARRQSYFRSQHHAVRGLAEQDQAGVADCVAERVEVGEVCVGRIDRADG